MDSDVFMLDIPSLQPAELLKSLNKNCKAAEELAVETATSNDAPLINAFRELTRGDCWQIMRKQQSIFNVMEQALVLSGLTDYIACAFENALFDTFRKKYDRDSFGAMLLHLNDKWMRFFRKLGRYDLSYTQLKSVISLLNSSLKRLPERYRNQFIKGALIMGENSLERARLHTLTNLGSFTDPGHKNKSMDCKTTEKNDNSAKLQSSFTPPTVKLSVNSDKNHTDPLPKNKSKKDMKNKFSVVNSTPVSSKPSKVKKTNAKKRTLDLCQLPTVDLTFALHSETKNTETSRVQKRTLDFVAPPTIDLTSNKKMRKTDTKQKRTIDTIQPPKVESGKPHKKKYKSDITKYILKASENKEETTAQPTVNKSSSNGKENISSSESSGSELDFKLKDLVTHTTPTGKLSSAHCTDSPTKKKSRTDKKITNAFEVMMKQSRAVKGQTVKRKSLFQ